MDQLLVATATSSSTVRVAVIGNSNSAMLSSFGRILTGTPNTIVTNRSIGATPSVILLDFLGYESNFDYDYVIIETAVCDFLGRGTHTRERARETLELFIRGLRLVSNAQIIMLTIPTRIALLEPGTHWQESLYRDVAEQFSIPILNGFDLIRRLVGPSKMAQIEFFSRRIRNLIESFRLPGEFFYSLVWHSLRDKTFEANALGIFGFNDDMHFSAPMHALVASLLQQFIRSGPTRPRNGLIDGPYAGPPLVIASEPIGPCHTTRKSSLIARDLLVLSSGETARYRCPPGYRAFGLMLNASAMPATLAIQSPAGSAILNLLFRPQPLEWVAIIVPILELVGDGDIEIALTPGTGPSTDKIELGELILVRTNWRELVPFAEDAGRGAYFIEDAPEAKSIIANSAAQAHVFSLGVDINIKSIDNNYFPFAAALLASTKPLSHADRARLMVVTGMMDKLPGFLDAACAEHSSDAELQAMRTFLEAVKAEDNAPHALMNRALGLARSGATEAADVLLAEGMARFTGNIGFFIESASNAARQKNWPEAQRRWSLVQSAFPHAAAGYVGGALNLRDTGCLDEAASMLARASELVPTDPAVFVEQAWLEHRRGAWDAASRIWSIIREKFPNNPAGYIGGAATYHDSGRFTDADNVIVEGKSRRPGDRDIAFWWADLAARRSEWHEAGRRWLSLRSSFPTEVRCMLDAARGFTKAGDTLRADALLVEAQASFPDDMPIAFKLAEMADLRQDWAAAAARWKFVRQRLPTEKTANLQEINAREQLGDLDAAEDIAGRAVGLFPDHIDVLLRAGAVAARRGDPVTAAERYEAAYLLDRNNAGTVKLYLEVLIDLDRRADAAVVLDEAISKWPGLHVPSRARLTDMKDAAQ